MDFEKKIMVVREVYEDKKTGSHWFPAPSTSVPP